MLLKGSAAPARTAAAAPTPAAARAQVLRSGSSRAVSLGAVAGQKKSAAAAAPPMEKTAELISQKLRYSFGKLKASPSARASAGSPARAAAGCLPHWAAPTPAHQCVLPVCAAIIRAQADDAKDAYKGAAWAVREQLIDALESTHEYWMWVARRTRARLRACHAVCAVCVPLRPSGFGRALLLAAHSGAPAPPPPPPLRWLLMGPVLAPARGQQHPPPEQCTPPELLLSPGTTLPPPATIPTTPRRQQDPKFTYYLSAEFLMGRSLLNTVYNLGLEGDYAKVGELDGVGAPAGCLQEWVDGWIGGWHHACMHTVLGHRDGRGCCTENTCASSSGALSSSNNRTHPHHEGPQRDGLQDGGGGGAGARRGAGQWRPGPPGGLLPGLHGHAGPARLGLRHPLQVRGLAAH